MYFVIKNKLCIGFHSRIKIINAKSSLRVKRFSRIFNHGKDPAEAIIGRVRTKIFDINV